ncbi:MAG: NAD-glutamate dehydrogenase [Streptosporangiales bacterium]|nr:NAD-glutamate dehydrogenase [Streptosporangiales bacterium]
MSPAERLDEAKDDALRRAAETCGRSAGAGTLDLLRMYYHHVAPEDVIERDPADVCGPALSQRALAEQRPQGRAKVRVFNPTLDEHGWDPGHTVVEIVTDDMPFLVDSVTMELSRHEIGVHLVVHPQVALRRDVAGALLGIVRDRDASASAGEGELLEESWMHVEVDRQPGGAVLKELEDDLLRVLSDVRCADEDAAKMAARATGIADDFAPGVPGVGAEEVAESVGFLRWLAAGHFTFVGCREYDLVDGDADGEGDTLRPVPGTGLGVLRADKSASDSFAALPTEARAKAREKHLLVLTKANSRSTVHRPNYLDYVGVKKFDADGEVVGERRFLGLFTHEAYSASISHVPLLRRKLAEVLDAAGLAPDSHDGLELTEILEYYPRDELFQTPVDELLPIVLGVLRLRERKRTKLFLRKDPYGRYMSCLVFLPRDRYTTPVRMRIQKILLQAFGATNFDYSAMVTDSALARLQVVVRADRGTRLPDVDPAELEAKVVDAARSWGDDLTVALNEQCGEERAPGLARRYADAFPEGYKADFPARTAVTDLRRLEELDGDGSTALNLYEPYDAGPGERRFKIYRGGSPITLSSVLPLLERMGVEVVDERPYRIDRAGGPSAWIYDFGLRYRPGDLDPRAVKELFEAAFGALWRGEVESDGFNALVLRAGLTWREVMVLRAFAKYLRQAGTRFSQSYIEQVLVSHVHITKLLVRLFAARLDPRRSDGRDEYGEAIAEEIRGELDAVESLDADRILRSYLAMIEATLRTNHFQTEDGEPKAYLSLKFAPELIPDLPLPRPKLEVFVYSPRMEGAHLRFAPVARGGLRWSDRFEDFRTEILGLVKAQTVKNSVIVPTGAKGGFVCKRLPEGGDRETLMKEVVACYRQLICGLLDITDNLVGGQVVHPKDVVRLDADDTYLVVAADKGTATFSDIANGIAGEYGFWLGDAFASGGSVGYDHKAMGITARGGWESVKYHFRGLGMDTQAEDFTVVGVGDMSGDVFGNGMLLSPHIRLVAAFDHRHIFLDPDPDAARGFAERERMFRLPRSSWADYDASLISSGGGVYARTAKSVPITPQVRAALGIEGELGRLAPDELIKAILRAPVDLFWNGGIGTYVKSSLESHADAGDKANDTVRVDASELRCRVVGEGGNLGLTQLARIEFARAGGHVNTDFIDNSAGVDASDHEVNIKIMLDGVVRDGDMTKKQRDTLFLAMTDEVAELVLQDNHHQNQVLAAAREQSAGMLHVHARYMRKLERDGHLKRKLEFLPDEKALAERRSAGEGLTSPEFSILLAYTKITMKGDLLASDLPDDPYLRRVLVSYFPSALRERFAETMLRHPLRREIITNAVVNNLVNRSGTTFVFRMNEETGAPSADIARAYLVAENVLGMPEFWEQVEALDQKVDRSTQLAMMFEGRKLTERAARWLLNNRRPPYAISDVVGQFADGVATIVPYLPKLLVGRDLAAFEERRNGLLARGVPEELAVRTAAMVPTYSAFDLIQIATDLGMDVKAVAEVYFDLADRLQLSRLRERVIALPRDDRWDTMARSALRDDLYAAHAALTRDVLVTSGNTEAAGSPEERLGHWAEVNAAAVIRSRQTLSEIWESDRFNIATLSVALRAIRTLVDSAS